MGAQESVFGSRTSGASPRFPAPDRNGEDVDECADSRTYNLGLLGQSLRKWRSSGALRLVYGEIYRQMAGAVFPGPALEIGSGIGVMREFFPDVVTSDVTKTPFVDLAASAYDLGQAPGGPWAAIHLLDVLHHLREPFRFFASAAGVLQPSGRIVIMDPAATVWGTLFYRMFHHEPIGAADIREPYVFPPDSSDGDFANMAMAWSLFVRDREIVAARLREIGLKVRLVSFRDVLGYALTGGFSRPALLPTPSIESLLRFENALPQGVLRRVAVRMLVVLERTT